MELKNIETFLKVATNQNLSKTAEQMGYSQSAVTVQIQKLERELGVQLFERIGKRIYLTEQGAGFLPYANDIVKATSAAMAYSQGETEPHGILRIGGVESICTAILPKLLPKFYQLCPNVEVIVRSGYTMDLLNLLDSNDLDTVFTLDEKINRKELVCQAFHEEPIIFVTMADGGKDSKEIGEKRKLSASKLCQQPFILTEHQAPYRCRFEQFLANKDLSIRPMLEIGNTETIINLLKKGMGVSLLPKFTVNEELITGTLTEVETTIPPISIYNQLFCHKGKWMTPQLKIFIDIVREYFGECI